MGKYEWTDSVDVWALGAIIFECAQGFPLKPETIEPDIDIEEAEAKAILVAAEAKCRNVRFYQRWPFV